MPAKPKGGKRQHRNKSKDADYARELVLKEEGEDYGITLKELGNRMLRIFCLGDEKIRRCHIPKKVRERIRFGDLVLITKRDYSTTDDEADIFHKYQPDEVKQLKEFGHIPENLEAILEAEATKIGVDIKKEAAAALLDAQADENVEGEPEGDNEKMNDDEIDDL